MKQTKPLSRMDCCRFLSMLTGLLMLLLGALPATAKVAIDFDPNLDFSKYKTFAYIGGQEQLLRLQLNPDQFNNQAVVYPTRGGLAKKKLRRKTNRRVYIDLGSLYPFW